MKNNKTGIRFEISSENLALLQTVKPVLADKG